MFLVTYSLEVPRESPTAPFDGQFEMAILYQELPVVVADLTYPNQEFSTWGQLVRGYGRQLTLCSYESNFLSDHESNHLWSSAIQNACRLASQYRMHSLGQVFKVIQ